MNTIEVMDRGILVALIGIGLYVFFALIDWFKHRKGQKMFVICNWCGMMFKENDCIKNKFAYTGYFCKECFKTYEDAKLSKG